jgi:hypothetical protein
MSNITVHTDFLSQEYQKRENPGTTVKLNKTQVEKEEQKLQRRQPKT